MRPCMGCKVYADRQDWPGLTGPAAGRNHAVDDTVNVIGSVQVAWCNLIQATLRRVAGIKVNIAQRSTGDPRLAAAAEQPGWRTVGSYLGPLGFACDTALLAKRELALPRNWANLLLREVKGEVQRANPAGSGGADPSEGTGGSAQCR